MFLIGLLTKLNAARVWRYWLSWYHDAGCEEMLLYPIRV